MAFPPGVFGGDGDFALAAARGMPLVSVADKRGRHGPSSGLFFVIPVEVSGASENGNPAEEPSKTQEILR
jgi:hypothetical protein